VSIPTTGVSHQGNHALAAPDPSDHLCVVSWNIQFGENYAAAARAFRESAPLRRADIILLQEMDEIGTDHIGRSAELNYFYAAAGVHPKTGRNFGNAVMSPWPLRFPDVVPLPYKSLMQGQFRMAVRATLDIDGTPIDACSVHTEVPSLSSPKRMRQFEEIAKATADWPSKRTVIGGDFNTLTRRGINALGKRMRTIDAHRVSVGAGPTLRRAGQDFVLDHVFARGLSPVAAGVVDDIHASDHRPLWVRLAIDQDDEDDRRQGHE
jgi:endonuclease/exonuclease/phosphatase family metal-dependent hydrolase